MKDKRDTNFNVRLDKATTRVLTKLSNDLNFTKTGVVRRAVRVLSQILPCKDEIGQIIVIDQTKKNEHRCISIE